MTPAARISAAIEVLDTIAAGAPAERALTNWARANRYAGSGDRAAIRDHVFDVLRRWRSTARLGGGDTGRARMLGHLVQSGQEPARLFTGARFAPQPVSGDEAAQLARAPQLSQAEALDLPDWLCPLCLDSLSGQELDRMRDRAPLYLRVNLARMTRDELIAALAGEGICTFPHPLSPGALRVEGNPRGLRQLRLYLEGAFEFQDAASQAAADMVPLPDEGGAVLDFCAGGGGKTLALAARSGACITAHDIDPARMQDLGPRARRAGAQVATASLAQVRQAAPFATVLCDVPCSGSGAWRRAPAGKWSLTPERLETLCKTQAAILDQAGALVARGGYLAFMTCSILAVENEAQVARFLTANTDFHQTADRRFVPSDGGDGFYCAILKRNNR